MPARSQHASKKLLLGAALSLIGSCLALACSTKGGDSQVDPCVSPLTCSAKCSATTGCASGQYCGPNSVCKADCVSGDDRCGTGKTCNAQGKCEGTVNPNPDMTDGGTINPGNGGAGQGPDADACIKLDVTFTPQIPTVVMLIDQSGSMRESFGTGTRWNVLRDALIAPNTGIISTLQSKVRFGLALYTSLNGFGDSEPKRVCPMITDVPPALNNYDAIAAKYLPDDSKDDTPTGESVAEAVKILDQVKEEGPKVIVLATDGEPDTCVAWDEMGQAARDAARLASLTAVQTAFKNKITTFVISVGGQVGEDHLRAVANAGQGLAVEIDNVKRFYLADSQAELATAFDSIVNGVRSCVLALNGAVDASSANTGSVVLDGKPLTYMSADGWRLPSATELELQGAACTAIKNGDHDLKISFPCGVITPK